MSSHSVAVSTSPCQRYTDSIWGTTLTQAASCRSTSVWAILRASSSDPQVVSTTRLSVICLSSVAHLSALEVAVIKSGGRILPEAYEATDGNANQVWHLRMARGYGRRVHVCQCPPRCSWHSALCVAAKIDGGQSHRGSRPALSRRNFLRHGGRYLVQLRDHAAG